MAIQKPQGLTKRKYSAFLASVLESIPLSTDNSTDVGSLFKKYKRNRGYSSKDVLCFLFILETFGAIELCYDRKIRDYKVRAKTPISTYFLLSLAAYVRKGLVIIPDWEREGIYSDPSASLSFTSGPQLVYLMENRRVVDLNDQNPIRQVTVSQCIIKAKVWGKRRPLYLVQYDEKARQYQLIGGWKRPTDKDSLAVIKKELGRELALNQLVYGKDYTLMKLKTHFKVKNLSRTYGAYSEYSFHFYQAKILKKELLLGPNDKWITKRELLRGRTENGARISSDYLVELNKKHPGGLDALPLSLKEIQGKLFAREAKRKALTVSEFLKQGESFSVEFKSSMRWDYTQKKYIKALEKIIMKTIAGFLNGDGGSLLIGITDDKEVVGIEKDMKNLRKKDVDGFEELIINLFSSYLGIEFIPYIKISFEQVEKKTVCTIRVNSSPHPVFMKESDRKDFCVRAGNTTKLLNSEETYRYIQSHWESE